MSCQNPYCDCAEEEPDKDTLEFWRFIRYVFGAAALIALAWGLAVCMGRMP